MAPGQRSAVLGLGAAIARYMALALLIAPCCHGRGLKQAINCPAPPPGTTGAPCVAITSSPSSPMQLGGTTNWQAVAADSNPGGSITMISWFVSDTAGNHGTKVGVATLSNGVWSFSYTPASAGTFYFSAKAWNTAKLVTWTSQVAVTIIGGTATKPTPTVTNHPPTVTVTSLTSPVTLYTPVSQYYIGVSASDTDGYVIAVQVYANGVLVPNSNVYGVVFSTSTAGTYVFTATATDSGGATTTSAPSAPMTVVDYVNVPPTVSIDTLTSPSTMTAPVSLYISVNAVDPDGHIMAVQVYANGSPVPNSNVYGVSFETSTPGTYVFTATATDSAGAAATSAPTATLTVVEAPPATDGGSGGSSGGGGGGSYGGGSMCTLTVVGGTGSVDFSPYTTTQVQAFAPPAGQVFDKWVSSSGYPQFGNQYNYSTTITTSATTPITITATYKPNTPMPFPVSSHPRLMVTTAQLPSLQAIANNANPVYAQGFKPALSDAVAKVNGCWSWTFLGGSGAPLRTSCWHDTGSANFEGDTTEAYAEIMAFGAMIENNFGLAQRAKDLFMWVIKGFAANGYTNDPNLPFSSSGFATYNRANAWGEGFGLVFDWLQYWPGIFTAAEKAMVRKVFMGWAEDNIYGYMAPAPARIVNNPLLITNNKGFRNIANNYATTHGRQMAYYALSIDAADDTVNDPYLAESFIGNTLRSYIYDVTGSWLYQKYACMEQPATVAADLGVPASTPGLGECGHGGLAPEGFLYGGMVGATHQTLQALYNAGWGTEALSGPQIKLLTSSYWDRFVQGFLHGLTPAPFMATGGNAYMGQVWQMFNYGDLLRLYIDPPQYATWGTLGWWAKTTGNVQLQAQAQWFGYNVILGGPVQFWQRISQPWGNSYATHTILYFLNYDPAALSALPGLPDPRPALPSTTFYDPSINRVLARSDWSPMAAIFTYKCSWEGINHQLADAGQFEFFRKGEFLTKEVSGYALDAPDALGASSVLHNTLTIQNSPNDPTLAAPTDLSNAEQGLFPLGSQQAMGFTNGGDPTTAYSKGQGYVHATSDFTQLYNRPVFWTPSNSAVDVLLASRSIVWLDNDFIVVYDRAATGRTNKFKRFNLNFVSQPILQPGTGPGTASPAVVVATSPTSGQRLAVTSLLPSGPSASVSLAISPPWNQPAEYEPSRWLMQVEDTLRPTSTRFLHVLQGADGGAPLAQATLVVGAVAGQGAGSYQGAAFGGYVVMFANNAAAGPASSVSYPLPGGPVSSHILTGLVPNTQYALTLAGGAATVQQGVAGQLLATTDSAGVARF